MQWIRLKLRGILIINKRSVGNEYENRAVEYLKNQGVLILERNFRSRTGEIDIIGKDKEYLVFYEVKYRKSSLKGHPEEAVNYKKIRTICKVSDYYRLIKNVSDDAYIRFDVLALNDEEINHIKNAFDYTM